MTTIARLAVVAAAAVVGAAITDVIWRGRYIARDRDWRQRFNRLSMGYEDAVTPSVARNNSGRATRRTA